jgi:hypothetical protein
MPILQSESIVHAGTSSAGAGCLRQNIGARNAGPGSGSCASGPSERKIRNLSAGRTLTPHPGSPGLLTGGPVAASIFGDFFPDHASRTPGRWGPGPTSWNREGPFNQSRAKTETRNGPRVASLGLAGDRVGGDD